MDFLGKQRRAAKRKTVATDAAIAMMKEIEAEQRLPLTQAEEIAQFKKSLDDAKWEEDEDDL